MIYTDLDCLEAHLLQVAPSDAALVREYIQGARAYTRFEMIAALLGPSRLPEMLPHLGAMGKWSGITLQCGGWPVGGSLGVVRALCKHDRRRFVAQVD